MRGAPNQRIAQRQQTRERILDAAIEEFARVGTAAADLQTVVAAAGVARSTFNFHFPTREHVLLELIRREETRVADELADFLTNERDLPAVLDEIVRLVVDLEDRWGPLLFRDVLGLYFSSARPDDDEWTDHPTIVLLAAEILRARNRGQTRPDVDSFHSAVFFLLGLYALLTTLRDSTPGRDSLLRKYIVSSLHGIGAMTTSTPHKTPLAEMAKNVAKRR
ncbi:TetR/AcrR family transcriptional regulator [Mycobacterium paraterrae]|uniref:TetR/AcrR family transcriptional regulator n=1 Tax=Mycobacterium paraterrae TaxID=577492 RepID=A0ABY3VNC5_9MYCO|nr:TetR/AcrR family transcriptional regulator [Mycobacterium paraterrae]UMB69621.1 TetR/AcrR family transcriptional regulator [Mycobacterium paraterrae]